MKKPFFAFHQDSQAGDILQAQRFRYWVAKMNKIQSRGPEQLGDYELFNTLHNWKSIPCEQ